MSTLYYDIMAIIYLILLFIFLSLYELININVGSLMNCIDLMEIISALRVDLVRDQTIVLIA